MSTEKEVQTISPISSSGFSMVPRNLEEAMQFSKLIAESDLVPKDYKGKPGNVIIAMQMGMEIGLPPLQAVQQIAVINGRPAVWGDAIMALVKNHPKYEWITETYDETTKTASCLIKRQGEPAQVRTFSEADANAAGLTKKDGPWQNYRKRMLQLRARAFACRDVFPDALKGLRVVEEERDTMKDMGNAERLPEDQQIAGQPKRGSAAAQAALPPFDQADFDKKLPMMAKSIKDNKNTVEGLISKLATKYTLSDDQKAKIQALGKPAAAPATDKTTGTGEDPKTGNDGNGNNEQWLNEHEKGSV